MNTYAFMSESDLESDVSDSRINSRNSTEDLSLLTSPLTAQEEEEEDEEQAGSFKFSEKPAFQYGVGMVIVLNTIVISLEAAYVQRDDMKHFFAFVEFLFTVIYVAEITIRLREIGFRPFFSGSDCGWNLFDFTITATGVIDCILTSVGFAGVGASAARLFRVLRIMRLFRAFRFLSEIDYVVHTASRAVLKLAMLVLLVVFVSAIVVTNILWDSSDTEVAGMYSNLGASMWTMFKLMTLENWIGAVERTANAKPGILPFFVCFIFVASIALMSLVPAIFIELNLSDKEKAEQRRVQKEREDTYKSKARVLKHFFKMVDRNGNGLVSISEMSWFLKHSDRVDEVQASGVATSEDVRDAKLGLFDLWESKLEEHDDRDVEMNQEEFLSGVLQSWGVINEKTLWRSITATRKQLRELTSLAKRQQAQLDRQQQQFELLLRMHGAHGAALCGTRSSTRFLKEGTKDAGSEHASTAEGSGSCADV